MKGSREHSLTSGVRLIIDPPEGWRFGFPKEVPIDVYEDEAALSRWLIEQGYPGELLELGVNYSRMWYDDG